MHLSICLSIHLCTHPWFIHISIHSCIKYLLREAARSCRSAGWPDSWSSCASPPGWNPLHHSHTSITSYFKRFYLKNNIHEATMNLLPEFYESHTATTTTQSLWTSRGQQPKESWCLMITFQGLLEFKAGVIKWQPLDYTLTQMHILGAK